jgi:DNA-binding transcriptional MerR regulator
MFIMKQEIRRSTVCLLTGVSQSSLIRWEKKGLIPKSKAKSNGYRFYYLEDVEKIKRYILNFKGKQKNG